MIWLTNYRNKPCGPLLCDFLNTRESTSKPVFELFEVGENLGAVSLVQVNIEIELAQPERIMRSSLPGSIES